MQILQKLSQKYFVKTEEKQNHKTCSTSNNGAAMQELYTETNRNDSVKYEYQSILKYGTFYRRNLAKNDLLHESCSQKQKKQLLNIF